MIGKIGVIFFLLAGIHIPAFSQHEDIARHQIFLVLERQKDAWNHGNIENYMNDYWKSDSLLFTSGGNIQRGWNATYEKYKKNYDSKEKMGELKFSELEIKLLSKESAWVFGHWALKRDKDNPKGVFTLILRKFADGWKIIHDHTSVEESQKEKVKNKM